MQMVIAHEVGHALGFPHNMGASCAYDVENYRKAPRITSYNVCYTKLLRLAFIELFPISSVCERGSKLLP